jgi:hypothetical protein
MTAYNLESSCPICDKVFGEHTTKQLDVCYKISCIKSNEYSVYYHENEGFHQ